ncbi:MAG: serine hydrolase [Gemmatimonadetes bacterium]|nr:serine hydrolase [Gemmatimonadota bacterium]
MLTPRIAPTRRPHDGRLETLLGTLAALIVASAAPLHAQSDPLQGFDGYVQKAVTDWGATGLAVAVVKDGELLFTKGYGVRAVDAGGAVDEHTRFAIGSTTKAMTAAALGMLVDEGKLSWDDPVTKYLPWFQLQDPWVTREITIRDLLTHRAGLGNADFLWYQRHATTRQIVEKLRLVKPAYSMRSSFIYQNLMYATAGMVVAQVSGMPWADFVRTRIWRPIGMNETLASLAETEGQPDVARPHDRVDGKTVRIENASVDPVAAAGSVWSSVWDMSKWERFLLAGGVTEDGTRLLKASTVNELFKPETMVPLADYYPASTALIHPHWTTYGLGWFQEDYRGEKVDFHTGSIDGMVAIAGLIRDRNLGVYVLANRDHVEVRHALMYAVFDRFIGGPQRDWSTDLRAVYDSLAAQGDARQARAEEERVKGTSPSLPLASYAGRYSDPLFGELVVTERPDGLRANLGPGRPGTLEHWSYDTFRLRFDARWRGSMVGTFVLSPDGKVALVRIGGFELRREPDGQGGGSGD